MVVFNVVHENFGGLRERHTGSFHFHGGMGPLHERYVDGGCGCHHGGIMPFGQAEFRGRPQCSCGRRANPFC